MPKQITAWVTSDNQTHTTEKEAHIHEAAKALSEMGFSDYLVFNTIKDLVRNNFHKMYHVLYPVIECDSRELKVEHSVVEPELIEDLEIAPHISRYS